MKKDHQKLFGRNLLYAERTFPPHFQRGTQDSTYTNRKSFPARFHAAARRLIPHKNRLIWANRIYNFCKNEDPFRNLRI
jgi:hypothetical protein